MSDPRDNIYGMLQQSGFAAVDLDKELLDVLQDTKKVQHSLDKLYRACPQSKAKQSVANAQQLATDLRNQIDYLVKKLGHNL